jgi:ubiquinone/menaquinone biosynthesis C-methylase UbiE
MKDNFSNQAATYAQFRPTYPKSLFDFILQHVDNKQVAWDCATGNGQAASVLADYFERVEATDISQKQLDNAVKKSNINYSIQAAENTQFPDNSFDLITVAQAVHWFNFDAFNAEIKRVAKPNAIVAIWGYGTLSFDEKALNNCFMDFYWNKIGKYWDKERAHIDNHYADIPFPFEKIGTPQYSMLFKWRQPEFEGYLNTWSSIQNFKKAHKDATPIDDFMLDISAYWDEFETKIVRFPIFMTVGRIKK